MLYSLCLEGVEHLALNISEAGVTRLPGTDATPHLVSSCWLTAGSADAQMLYNLCLEGVEQSHHLALMALKLVDGMLALLPECSVAALSAAVSCLYVCMCLYEKGGCPAKAAEAPGVTTLLKKCQAEPPEQAYSMCLYVRSGLCVHLGLPDDTWVLAISFHRGVGCLHDKGCTHGCKWMLHQL